MHVLCVTPNAAVDRTLSVPGFAVGGVWRAAEVAVACGGKGVNVARAVRGLWGQAVNAGILAGHTGRLAAELAAREGLDAAWTWVDGESRTCVIVVGDGASTVVNEPGTSVTTAGWARFTADVGDAARAADAVCISGSLPPGCPEAGLGLLVRAAAGDAGRPVWVDTSGAALIEALEAPVFGIKVNGAEAAAALNRTVDAVPEAADAARHLVARGVPVAAITLGRDGAVLATSDGSWHARPPAVPVVNATGSGDAVLAGLVVALGEGATPPEALARAVAAGSASATDLRAAHVDLQTVRRILADTVLEPAG